MEKISIVIPINNAALYLRQCLEAILNQEFKDFKLILINDGSTDESGGICRDYAEKDNRIIVCHQRSQGIGAARNKGLELAEGKYIMFVDPNDWIGPGLLQEVYEQAETEETDWIIWSLNKVFNDSHQRIIASKSVQAADLVCKTANECKNQFVTMIGWGDLLLDATWNKLYRKDIIEKNQIKFATIKREQDIIFNLEYYKHIKSFIATSKIYSDLQVKDKVYDDKILREQYDAAYFNHLRYRQLLDLWRREKDEAEFVDYHFLLDIFDIMKQCMNTEWKMGFFKRYAYIKTLMKKIEVKEIAKYIGGQHHPGGLRGRVIKRKINYIRKQKFLRMVMLYYMENVCGHKDKVKKV